MIKNNWLVLAIVLGSVGVARAESDDGSVEEEQVYNHFSAFIGSGTTNKNWFDGSNASFFEIRFNKPLSSGWLMEVDYSVQFFHPDNFTARVDRVLISGGYHHDITSRLDVYALYGVGLLGYEQRDNKTDKKLDSQSDLLQGARLGFNYLINREVTLTLEGEFTRSDWVDEDNIKLAFNYQWNDVFGTGIFYKYRDAGKDYISEGGISARVIY
ncbi:hypothetical protein ATY37_11715 [Vibrio cidicii]|uniref:Outer membrane protein beta-barrel domain-containing protein n=1 Tax=Vibrio cidicii TaxID=1763883 RepID=A0A151KZX0_9VIBR|nr:hypothetical protein [Vibrio cidicii]ELV8625048.1 hypothetical protein [Vibrio cidicii]KYN84049.1 hypothetical protein ATY36_07770 [Vibrio cidicii]KYN89638.1 hypothetical protein ATY37_11715 [Vibrio cidicii]MBG0758490.1 hypothetical protein [Vibrio cidicii]